MKKNGMLFLITFVVLSSLALYPQEPGVFTLEDTIKLVLRNNLSIAEAADAEAIVNARIEQSRSGLYPAVKGEAAYNRLGPAPQLTIPDFGSFKFFPNDNYDIHVAGQYLLFDFNRTRETIHLAQTQIDTVKDRLETLKRDLVYQTVQVFYTILFLQENIKMQDAHIRILDEHLSRAQKKMESGTATELEVLTTQVRLTSAQSQTVELQSSLEKQQIVLRKLMGLPVDSGLEIKGEFLLMDWKSLLEKQSFPPYLTFRGNYGDPRRPDNTFTGRGRRPPDEGPSWVADATRRLLEKALNERIEIKAVNHALETAKVQSSLARLADKPSLHLNLLVGVKDGYFPHLTRPFLNFVAGVQVDAAIFDGYRSKNLRGEASANIKMIEDRKRDVEEMIKSEVLQALKDVEANNKKLEMLDINIRSAEKAVDFARVQYEAGTVTNLDLLVAEEARTDAAYLRLQALYRCVLSEYSLQRAVGISMNN